MEHGRVTEDSATATKWKAMDWSEKQKRIENGGEEDHDANQ